MKYYYLNHIFLLGLVLFASSANSQLTASSSLWSAKEFLTSYDDLEKCLSIIERERKVFDIILYNLHNSIKRELKNSNREIKKAINKKEEKEYIKEISLKHLNGHHQRRHLVVNYFLENKNLELLNDEAQKIEVSFREKLSNIYSCLQGRCNDIIKKIKLNPYPEKNLQNVDDIFDGTREFSLDNVLSEPGLQYHIEDAISRGLGIPMKEVSYNPKTQGFTIYTDKDGNILPNDSWKRETRKRIDLKKASGIQLTQKDLEDEDKLKKYVAGYMYVGTLGTFSKSEAQQCQMKSNGEYCPTNLITTIRKVLVETSELKEHSPICYTRKECEDLTKKKQAKNKVGEINEPKYPPPSVPIYVSENLEVQSDEKRKIGNLNQFHKNIKNNIKYLFCTRRNDLFRRDNSESSAFKFRLPCGSIFLDEEARTDRVHR